MACMAHGSAACSAPQPVIIDVWGRPSRNARCFCCCRRRFCLRCRRPSNAVCCAFYSPAPQHVGHSLAPARRRYVSAGSIEYWPEPQRGITEAYRVTKPGGIACMIGPVHPTHPVSRFFADAWMLFPKGELQQLRRQSLMPYLTHVQLSLSLGGGRDAAATVDALAAAAGVSRGCCGGAEMSTAVMAASAQWG